MGDDWEKVWDNLNRQCHRFYVQSYAVSVFAMLIAVAASVSPIRPGAKVAVIAAVVTLACMRIVALAGHFSDAHIDVINDISGRWGKSIESLHEAQKMARDAIDLVKR